jgi:uncharacterized protein YbjT (DUF2867 family)
VTGRRILVTGATGRIGGRVAKLLCEEHGPVVRVLVRDAERARERLPGGVEIVVGDLDDPASLGAAVDGVDAVLLVSPVHPRQRELQGNLARAAAASGRPYLVKISGLGTALDSYVDSGRWHAETEADIRALGLPATFLRPYFFMQNLGFQIGTARRDGVIRAAVGEARIAMVDVADVAAVAARLLAGGVDLAGEAVAITGAEVLGYEQVASVLADVLGRDVRYERQSLAEARAVLEKSGMPGWHVEILLQFNRAFAEGRASRVTDLVERALGRSPRTLRAYLEDEVRARSASSGENPFPS